jgi:hypothetical protein
MEIEVKQTARQFVVTLSEEEAAVLKGVVGGLYFPLPTAAEEFFDKLEDLHVESKGDLVTNGDEVRWERDDD